MARDWDVRADQLSAEALAHGEPTAWFDRLYAEGAAGTISMPWSRDEPQRHLRDWAVHTGLSGEDRRAVVVGCGLGADAEFVAGLGFDVTGFDISPHAIAQARTRHPRSPVRYQVADVLDLPSAWSRGFDLVVEVFTMQALPDPPRAAAMDGVADLVAAGGNLVAIALRLTAADDAGVGPPFPLSQTQMDGWVRRGLSPVSLVEVDGPLWRGVYRRPADDGQAPTRPLRRRLRAGGAAAAG